MRFAPPDSPLSGVILAIGLVMVLQSALGIVFGQRVPADARAVRRPRRSCVGGVPAALAVRPVRARRRRGRDGRARRAVHAGRRSACSCGPPRSPPRCRACSACGCRAWSPSAGCCPAAVGSLAALLLVPTELGLNPHSTDCCSCYALHRRGGRRARLARRRAGRRAGRRRRDEPGDRLPRRGLVADRACSCCSCGAARCDPRDSSRRRRRGAHDRPAEAPRAATAPAHRS